MNKTLKINENVPVAVYKNYSFPLSVICTDINADKWLNNHFLNVYLMYEDDGYIWYDFLEREKFFSDNLEQKFIKLNEICNYNIIDLIEQCITDDNYVTIFLDEYYIEDTYYYGKEHIASEFFIYGFDNEIRVFKGFCFNKNNILTLVDYTYDELQKAHHSLMVGREKFKDLPIWVYWYAFSRISKKCNISDKCNTNDIINNIRDYNESVNKADILRSEIIEEHGTNAIYGANTMQELLKAFYSLLDNKTYIDYRHIHLLYEHKRLMLDRLQYLCNYYDRCSEIAEEYSSIVKNMEICRMYYLKGVMTADPQSLYSQLKNEKVIKKIIATLEKTIINEKNILNRFVDNIIKNSC